LTYSSTLLSTNNYAS